MTELPTNVSPISAGRDSGSNGGGDHYGERLARIEARLEYFATKEDIQRIKVWILAGVLGGMSITAMLVLGAAKLFFS